MKLFYVVVGVVIGLTIHQLVSSISFLLELEVLYKKLQLQSESFQQMTRTASEKS